MNRAVQGAILVVAFVAAGTLAVSAEPMGSGDGLIYSLFAFATNAPEGVLRELGYSLIQHLSVTVDLDKEPACAADVKDKIRKLAGADPVVVGPA